MKRRQTDLQVQGKALEVGNIDLKNPTRKTKVKEIKGSEIYGSNFDINIDVMQGLVDSKLAESQMWDTLILNGGIQNMDPELLEMYISVNPTVTQHTRNALKAIIEKQKRSENYQLKQQLSQASAYLEKLLQYTKELEAQNGYKTNYIDNLTKEFTNKIGVANKVITAQNKQLSANQNVGQQVSEGQGKSMNALGVSGANITSTTQ